MISEPKSSPLPNAIPHPFVFAPAYPAPPGFPFLVILGVFFAAFCPPPATGGPTASWPSSSTLTVLLLRLLLTCGLVFALAADELVPC